MQNSKIPMLHSKETIHIIIRIPIEYDCNKKNCFKQLFFDILNAICLIYTYF